MVAMPHSYGLNNGIVPLYPFQVRAIESTARFNLWIWSRQTGKSFTISLRRLLRGMMRNRNQIFLSASGRQSLELMQKVIIHLKAIQVAMDLTFEDMKESYFEGTTIKQYETRVKAKNGAFDFRIIALAANPDTARGFTGDVFLDEFAMHKWSKEIWGSIFPTILRNDGEIDICSTPKGRKNMFYRLSQNKRFNIDRLTIDDAIAQGLEVDREALLEGMGDEDLIQQEFFCEFLDGLLVFLSQEMIASCEDANIDDVWNEGKIASCADEELSFGYDVARKKHLAVLWIWGKPKGSDVLYTRGVICLRNQPFRIQRETIESVMRLPNAGKLCIDATGNGAQLSEELAEKFGESRVECVTFTQPMKKELAEPLKVKVEDVRVRIPADADIRNDWHSVRRDVLPSGSFSYTAEEQVEGDGGKSHADRFWAAALGVRAASGNTGGNLRAGQALKQETAVCPL